ncbi:MAG: SDR family oxidoreductase [Myxococcota bacterium]
MSGQRPLRAIVVGASSGLGRCIGVGLAQRGAQVALLARRQELLAAAAEEARPGAVAIPCDVTDGASCQDAVGRAVERLGGIDAVVYAPGLAVLRPIEELDLESWRRTFDTNVVGASLFTAAALPHLVESRGVAAYLSTVSASFTAPWPGLASYTVTKAALDKLVEAWRTEHPSVGFSRVVVGNCAGGEGDAQTQFMAGFDPELLGKLLPVWASRGLLGDSLLEVDTLVHTVDAVLRCGASAAIPTVTLVQRPAG